MSNISRSTHTTRSSPLRPKKFDIYFGPFHLYFKHIKKNDHKYKNNIEILTTTLLHYLWGHINSVNIPTDVSFSLSFFPEVAYESWICLVQIWESEIHGVFHRVKTTNLFSILNNNISL